MAPSYVIRWSLLTVLVLLPVAAKESLESCRKDYPELLAR